MNNNADLSEFSIDSLLDGLYVIRVGHLDTPEWKEQQAKAKDKIIAELESRSTKDLVKVLVSQIRKLD